VRTRPPKLLPAALLETYREGPASLWLFLFAGNLPQWLLRLSVDIGSDIRGFDLDVWRRLFRTPLSWEMDYEQT
jgi:hypothetical protein